MDAQPQSGLIVVEGPIGVGKSSLAKRLAESFQCEFVREAAEENPFLEHFYRNSRNSALPVQLFFLTQRVRQWESMLQQDMFQQRMISDFMMEKDRLFAKLTLNDDEFRLYDQIHTAFSVPATRADLVIYLQAPVETLKKRVRKRGLASEKFIQDDYLENLSEAYAQFFLHYDSSPLLIVNAGNFNPIENDADYQELLKRIRSIRSGRHYFNPLPA